MNSIMRQLSEPSSSDEEPLKQLMPKLVHEMDEPSRLAFIEALRAMRVRVLLKGLTDEPKKLVARSYNKKKDPKQ